MGFSAIAAALVAATVLSSCSTTTSTGSDAAAEASGGLEARSCKDLIPEVIRYSEVDDRPNQEIIAVYKPKLIRDAIEAFNAGQVKAPPPGNDLVVLECEGEATFADGTEAATITFLMTVDKFGETHVLWLPA